jgi:nuclear pore complex protein Nup62
MELGSTGLAIAPLIAEPSCQPLYENPLKWFLLFFFFFKSHGIDHRGLQAILIGEFGADWRAHTQPEGLFFSFFFLFNLFFFKLGIFLFYISNAIPKVPHTLPHPWFLLLFMYVLCVYVFIMSVSVRVCAYMPMYMCVSVYVCMYLWMWVGLCVFVCVYLWMYSVCVCVCVCVCICMHEHTVLSMWRSKDSFTDRIFTFHLVDSGTHTQVVRISSKHLDPLAILLAKIFFWYTFSKDMFLLPLHCVCVCMCT